MSEGVEVTVRSDLRKILEDLQAIGKQSETLSNQFKSMSGDVGKEVKQNTKEVESGLNKLQGFGRRVADQLRQDFAALASVQSLAGGLKISEQFGGSIKEAVTLSDTVRRLGSVFGIAGKDFAKFQTLMQSGLGEIGLSSDAAANALKGLAETPVRGEKNLLGYAKAAGQLASISGEKGSEGTIAKGTAGIIRARGGDVNDMGQLSNTTKEILQIRQATGKSVTEITRALEGLYAGTNKQFQGSLQKGGSTSLATASLLGGPQATSFLESFMGQNKFQRLGKEAQGFKNIMNPQGGLNTQAIQSIVQEAKGRGMGDVQGGLTTMGLSDDEAKGFMRLADALKQNEAVINGAKDQVVDLNRAYTESMSMGDSFRASINKIKGVFSGALSSGTQGLTGLLGKASQSTGGAIAVTGAAALAAAVLTGGGLRGIGKGLLGGIGGDEAKKAAIEKVTGEKVQRVAVINWPAGGLGGGAADAASGLASKAGKFGLMGATAAAGIYAGTKLAGAAQDYADKNPQGLVGKADAGMQKFIDMLYQKFSGFQPAEARVKVDLNKKDLTAAVLPGRGRSN